LPEEFVLFVDALAPHKGVNVLIEAYNRIDTKTKLVLLGPKERALLSLSSPLLPVLGKKGYFWMKGILSGFMDYLRGDRGGAWQNA
jgi:glycosyltransferase involved in cell wall biosynthesis